VRAGAPAGSPVRRPVFRLAAAMVRLAAFRLPAGRARGMVATHRSHAMNRKLTLVLSLLIALVATATPAVAEPPRPGSAKADTPRPAATRPAVTRPASPRPAPATPGPAEPAALSLVVSPAWLAAHLEDPDLILLHVGDADAYRTKHIPGARRVTLDDLSVSVHDGTGLMLELPPAGDLRHRLEALGISTDSRVVVYFGEDWVSPATRVVLTLDAAGLGARAALLDGGMPAWVRDGHAVTDAAPPARPGKLAALALRPIIVDATTVVASLGKPGFVVVDARDRAFYDGTRTGGSPAHPHRTGHIAGALSIPFDSVFDDQLVLRSPDDLQARFTKAGVAPGDTVIGYCHIGQQATAMLFAARRLGHPVLLYDGSFEDWSQFHPGYPVERTPEQATDQTPDKAPGKTTDKAPGKTTDKATQKLITKPTGAKP
jgi:thiosulfate/3-mercaptopyruvate sulfurtransferase